MTLSQIASWINQQLRFKLHPDQIVLIMDAVQKLGFDENMKAFQVWNKTLTAYQVLTFGAVGYTNAVAGDIGRPVVQGSFTGTLISCDNTAREWVISTSDTFAASTAVTITGGTGAGTTAATDYQEGYVGPYAFPTSPSVRKFLGVTSITDAQIFGTEAIVVPETDYGLLPIEPTESGFYSPGRADELAGTFTFTNPPSLGVDYRWVYWREAPSITGTDSANDANLLLPARYHFNFIQACVKCARMTIKGTSFTREDVETDLGPWWTSLRRVYTPNGRAKNLTSMGRQSGSVLV